MLKGGTWLTVNTWRNYSIPVLFLFFVVVCFSENFNAENTRKDLYKISGVLNELEIEYS